MAKMCGSCSYYDADGDLHVCPECGAELQFTMLGPPNVQLDEEDESAAPAWERPEASQTELLEQPLPIRLSQITTGIVFYFFVWRYGSKVLMFCFQDMLMHEDATVALVTAGVIAIVLYIAAALVAGAIAGAWTVNWIPQGMGVGAGLFTIPLLLLFVVWPESLVFYLIVVFVTTAFTIAGAYIGHILVRPSRMIHS